MDKMLILTQHFLFKRLKYIFRIGYIIRIKFHTPIPQEIEEKLIN